MDKFSAQTTEYRVLLIRTKNLGDELLSFSHWTYYLVAISNRELIPWMGVQESPLDDL
jgi:hypothetical protein